MFSPTAAVGDIIYVLSWQLSFEPFDLTRQFQCLDVGDFQHSCNVLKQRNTAASFYLKKMS